MDINNQHAEHALVITLTSVKLPSLFQAYKNVWLFGSCVWLIVYVVQYYIHKVIFCIILFLFLYFFVSFFFHTFLYNAYIELAQVQVCCWGVTFGICPCDLERSCSRLNGQGQILKMLQMHSKVIWRHLRSKLTFSVVTLTSYLKVMPKMAKIGLLSDDMHS